MHIIASHRIGLVEQYEAEAIALAGCARDAVQRAIVYHHVADMSGLSHGYALLAAEAALGMDAALEKLQREAVRWRWGAGRAERDAAGERAARFTATLRAFDAERCAGTLMAYRLAATPGLRSEAAARLAPDMLAALEAAQSARGAADRDQRRALFEAHARWAEREFGERIERALADLDWRFAPAMLRDALAALRLTPDRFERAERRGLARIEQRIRRSKRMPATFAANPAQAFFKLQRQIVERRRRGADGDHLSPDEAVQLAA